MKKLSQIFIPMLVLATLLLSACTGTATLDGSKVDSALVDFTGVIESITGDQWVVNGQTFTVDPALVPAGLFKVGDTIQVQAEVAVDGSITVTNVGAPVASTPVVGTPVVGTPVVGTPVVVDNSNDDNGNDSNSNDDNGNDSNSNDDNGNDDDSNDANGNDDDSDDDNGNDDDSNDNEDNNNVSNDNSSNTNGNGG